MNFQISFFFLKNKISKCEILETPKNVEYSYHRKIIRTNIWYAIKGIRLQPMSLNLDIYKRLNGLSTWDNAWSYSWQINLAFMTQTVNTVIYINVYLDASCKDSKPTVITMITELANLRTLSDIEWNSFGLPIRYYHCSNIISVVIIMKMFIKYFRF